MLLNGSPLNSVPLNGAARSAAVAPPTPIVKGLAFKWRLEVLIGGVDMSSRLTGTVTIDRERGAAGVASFVLQLLPGAVVPAEWVGRTVVIYYLSMAGGVTRESLRYTGRIVRPEWDPLMRLLSCQCGDQLQHRVEALTVAEVDALVGGYWSADVFEAVEGRSRWDYALERLSTLPASLDAAPDGSLRVSTWYAGPPDFEFGPDTTIYQSVHYSDADLTSLTNKVEIEADYRFARLWQQNIRYNWKNPSAGDFDGLNAFCVWRHDSGETPDVAMVESATEGAGLTMLDGAAYNRLPPSGVYCDPPAGWINAYPDLLLEAVWDGGRRWTQTVTEQYRLTVIAEASVELAGEVISRDRVAFEVETDRSAPWESDPFTTGTNTIEDVRAEPRRVSALQCKLHQAATEIIAAHTGTQVSWDVPTSMVMDVDLVHTLKLNDQGVLAQARCSRIADNFDLLAGTAITTLSIAVMRGGGAVSDALIPPAFVVTPPPPEVTAITLPTQLGSRNESPIYDETLTGFSGNYDDNDLDINADLVPFPRSLLIQSIEVEAEKRDELLVPLSATYRVSIPNDLLEL